MIHYHGTPISGGEMSQLAFQGKHACISFAAQESHEAIIELSQSFMLDNGAFSAWMSGKEFDIEGFFQWVKIWHRHPGFDFYCMPDVIGGGEEENIRMRATWFRMCQGTEIWDLGYPVWHLHEPLEVLSDFVSSCYPGVCFGSSGEYSEVGSKDWWVRMSEAMDVVTDDDGRPRARLHGLRMLDPTIFSHFPFKSADSTNVGRHAGSSERWKGAYVPTSTKMRALVMMDRIESHASASRWTNTKGVTKNMELFG